MSKTLLIGLSAALLLPVVASAQTPPTPPGGSASSNVDRGPPPPPPRDGMGPRGRGGAFIKLRGPGGAEIMVRCADGETTRECADVAGQLLDKAKSAQSERSMGGGGWHDDGDHGRWDRGGDRGRDRY